MCNLFGFKAFVAVSDNVFVVSSKLQYCVTLRDIILFSSLCQVNMFSVIQCAQFTVCTQYV